MHCGDLVADSTVQEMLRERSGCLFVLDGFPRTLGQAEALSQLMERESRAKCRGELRIGGGGDRVSPERRRICEKCKAVFHDRPESVKLRQEVYENSMAALVQFYRQLGLFVPVAATGSPEEICSRTISALEKRPVSLL